VFNLCHILADAVLLRFLPKKMPYTRWYTALSIGIKPNIKNSY
jgi:hypothetical protein